MPKRLDSAYSGVGSAMIQMADMLLRAEMVSESNKIPNPVDVSASRLDDASPDGVDNAFNVGETVDTRLCKAACCPPERPVALATASSCEDTPPSSITFGAGVKGVTSVASAEFAAYWYIAAASCAHISPYWASFIAIAGEFWPKKLVAVS